MLKTSLKQQIIALTSAPITIIFIIAIVSQVVALYYARIYTKQLVSNLFQQQIDISLQFSSIISLQLQQEMQKYPYYTQLLNSLFYKIVSGQVQLNQKFQEGLLLNQIAIYKNQIDSSIIQLYKTNPVLISTCNNELILEDFLILSLFLSTQLFWSFGDAMQTSQINDQISLSLLQNTLFIEPLLRAFLYENNQNNTIRKLKFDHCSIGSSTGLVYSTNFNYSSYFFSQPSCNPLYYQTDARCRSWYQEAKDQPSFYMDAPSVNQGDIIPYFSQPACQRTLTFNTQTNMNDLERVLCLEIRLSQLQEYFQNFVSSTKQLYVIDPRSGIIVFNQNQNKTDSNLSSAVFTLAEQELNYLTSQTSASQFQDIIQQHYNRWVYQNQQSINLSDWIDFNYQQIQFYYDRNGTNCSVILNPIILMDKPHSLYSGVSYNSQNKIQADLAYLQINILSDQDLVDKIQTINDFTMRLVLIVGILMAAFGCLWVCVTIYYSLNISRMLQEPIMHLTKILKKIQAEGKNCEVYSVLSEYDVNASEIFLSKETQELYESFQAVFQMLMYTQDNFFTRNPTETLFRLHRNIEFFKQFQNNRAVGITHNNIGNILVNQGCYFEALEHYSSAIIFASYEIQDYCKQNNHSLESCFLLNEYCLENGTQIDEQIGEGNTIFFATSHKYSKESGKYSQHSNPITTERKNKLSNFQRQLEKQIDQKSQTEEFCFSGQFGSLLQQGTPFMGKNSNPEQTNNAIIIQQKSNDFYTQRRNNQIGRDQIYNYELNSCIVNQQDKQQYLNASIKPLDNSENRQSLMQTLQNGGSQSSLNQLKPYDQNEYYLKKTVIQRDQSKLASQTSQVRDINKESASLLIAPNYKKNLEEQIELLSNLYYRKQNYVYALVAFQENLEQSKIYSKNYNFWPEICNLLTELLAILIKLPIAQFQEVIILSQISKSYFKQDKFKKAEELYSICKSSMKKLIQKETSNQIIQNPPLTDEKRVELQNNSKYESLENKNNNPIAPYQNYSNIANMQESKCLSQACQSPIRIFSQNLIGKKDNSNLITLIQEENVQREIKPVENIFLSPHMILKKQMEISQGMQDYYNQNLLETRHSKNQVQPIERENKRSTDYQNSEAKSQIPLSPLPFRNYPIPNSPLLLQNSKMIMQANSKQYNPNSNRSLCDMKESNLDEKFFKLKSSPITTNAINNYIKVSLFNLANNPSLQIENKDTLNELQNKISLFMHLYNLDDNQKAEEEDNFFTYFCNFQQRAPTDDQNTKSLEKNKIKKYQNQLNCFFKVQLSFIKAEYMIQRKQYQRAAEILTKIMEDNQTIISHFPFKIIFQLKAIFDKHNLNSKYLADMERRFNPNIELETLIIIDNYQTSNYQAIDLVSSILTIVLTKSSDKLSISFIHEDYIEFLMNLTDISAIKCFIPKIIEDILSKITNMKLENLIQLAEAIQQNTKKNESDEAQTLKNRIPQSDEINEQLTEYSQEQLMNDVCDDGQNNIYQNIQKYNLKYRKQNIGQKTNNPMNITFQESEESDIIYLQKNTKNSLQDINSLVAFIAKDIHNAQQTPPNSSCNHKKIQTVRINHNLGDIDNNEAIENEALTESKPSDMLKISSQMALTAQQNQQQNEGDYHTKILFSFQDTQQEKFNSSNSSDLLQKNNDLENYDFISEGDNKINIENDFDKTLSGSKSRLQKDSNSTSKNYSKEIAKRPILQKRSEEGEDNSKFMLEERISESSQEVSQIQPFKQQNSSSSYALNSSTQSPSRLNVTQRNLLFHLSVRKQLLSISSSNESQSPDQYLDSIKTIHKYPNSLQEYFEPNTRIKYPQNILGQQLYQSFLQNLRVKYLIYTTDEIVILENPLFKELCSVLHVMKVQLIIVASNKGDNFLEQQQNLTYLFEDQEVIKVFYSNQKVINYLKTKRNPFSSYHYTTFLQHY